MVRNKRNGEVKKNNSLGEEVMIYLGHTSSQSQTASDWESSLHRWKC